MSPDSSCAPFFGNIAVAATRLPPLSDYAQRTPSPRTPTAPAETITVGAERLSPTDYIRTAPHSLARSPSPHRAQVGSLLAEALEVQLLDECGERELPGLLVAVVELAELPGIHAERDLAVDVVVDPNLSLSRVTLMGAAAVLDVLELALSSGIRTRFRRRLACGRQPGQPLCLAVREQERVIVGVRRRVGQVFARPLECLPLPRELGGLMTDQRAAIFMGAERGGPPTW